MGKGDSKSRKGKISQGSYGNSRPRKPKNEATKAAKLGDNKKAPAQAATA